MNADFGVVCRYRRDKGFGFVSRVFLASTDLHSEVFFHVNIFRKACSELAERLGNEAAIGDTCFWYETQETRKGLQVRCVIDPDDLPCVIKGSLPVFIAKIEKIWRNIDNEMPFWIREVTVALLGDGQAHDLRSEREGLIKRKRDVEENRRAEQKARQMREEHDRQMLIDKQKRQDEVEEKEFAQLVAEMRPFGFRRSKDVSLYIIRNKLGYKYRNISGIVRMEQCGTQWDFKGGFPPHVYARLCQSLELQCQNTRARAVGFESFNDLGTISADGSQV